MTVNRLAGFFTNGLGQRLDERLPVTLQATIGINGQFISARLRNIAARGAMFDGLGPPNVNSKLAFRYGASCVGAGVAWQVAGHTGVCFDTKLAAWELASKISRSSAVAARHELKRTQSCTCATGEAS